MDLFYFVNGVPFHACGIIFAYSLSIEQRHQLNTETNTGPTQKLQHVNVTGIL
jgi:hypothetical protein